MPKCAIVCTINFPAGIFQSRIGPHFSVFGGVGVDLGAGRLGAIGGGSGVVRRTQDSVTTCPGSQARTG